MAAIFGHSESMAISLPPLEPLLDAKAVSRILGIHQKTVAALARRGLLPGIRYARRWHFRRADLILWIERQHATNGAESSPTNAMGSVHRD